MRIAHRLRIRCAAAIRTVFHATASGVRLADNTDIGATAAANAFAPRVVDSNDCGVFWAVAERVHGLSVLALGGDSDVVPALAEDAMKSFALADYSLRPFALAMYIMTAVTGAPNSVAAARTRVFALHCRHLGVCR